MPPYLGLVTTNGRTDVSARMNTYPFFVSLPKTLMEIAMDDIETKTHFFVVGFHQ